MANFPESAAAERHIRSNMKPGDKAQTRESDGYITNLKFKAAR